MKKMSRLAGIMTTVLTVSLLTGCLGKEEDPFSQKVEADPVKPAVAVTDDNNVTTAPDDTPDPEPVEEIDYEKIYAPIIEENIQTIEYGYNMDAEHKYLSNGIAEKVAYTEKDILMKQIGYVIMDINGDNVPEFLMGENANYDEKGDKSYILGGYTYMDGELVCFIDGWARSSNIWMGNGKIYYYGSNGVYSSLFGQKYLDSDCEVKWDDFYFSDEKDDGSIGFFHNKTGVYDIGAAEELDMEEDAFWNLYNDSKYELLNWKPFSEYKKQ